MFRKLRIIKLLIVSLFTLNTIFPSPSFSYQKTNPVSRSKPKKNWIDESRTYKPVMYKKVRCPRCGIEFYYIPGKEGPHSHWVQYEVKEKREEETLQPASKEAIRQAVRGEDKNKQNIVNLLTGKKTVKKAPPKPEEPSMTQLEQGLQPRYELRQKLTCPYDGYSFFPGGGVIEDKRLMHHPSAGEKPSPIEASFSDSIPFGVSRDLRQFGYDLFRLPEKEKMEREKKQEGLSSETLGRSAGALSTLGMLKSLFSPSSSKPRFSPQLTSETSVIPVGPDYIIGPGDTLVINIWGSVQESFPVEVDREGKIMLPKAGPLYVWGLKFGEAEKRIRGRLNKFYTNFNVDVSMGKLRNIQVYVMGEVKKPGSYSIASQSTVFQALYAAGGPTKLGTLRRIKIIHTDGKEGLIDLYKFLLQGHMSKSSRIQSGDTVFVPPLGDVVAIAGNVKRPGIYETKAHISLSSLLDFAGGITPTGDLQRLQVERIENNEKRIMLDIELKRTDVGKFSSKDIDLQNGDMVIVSPIVRLKHDFVSIIGNVERPGDYALTKDMKVSDLVKRAMGFLPGTYMARAEIARVTRDRTRRIIPVDLKAITLGTEESDMPLDEWDILFVYSRAEVEPPSFVEIDGAVNRPGRYELTPDEKISDIIFKAGGLRQDRFIRGAELFHIMPGEQPVVREIGIKQLSDINIVVDKDIILRSGDSLFVKSEPRLTERKLVTIKGEVRYPGSYSIREGERLSSIIERAGGFTQNAFLDGALFTRKSIREAQEKMRERFIERENRSLVEEQQAILLRRGTGISPQSISESVKMRREMLGYIASVKIEGRMVINLKPLSKLKGTKYDILMEDGDTLKIPQTPFTVTVMGSVNNPTSVPFEAGKGIEYYIRRTGGVTKHADRPGIYVIKANGEAVNKFMMSRAVEEGSTIVVPQEFKYWTPPGQLLRDTVEILSRIAVGVGIIAALN